MAVSYTHLISFRRAMKQCMQRTMRAGAKGIKTMVAGRLNGAEMARTEGYAQGNVPMQTLRANIDYGFAEADTTYGKLGIKVWVNKGEILTGRENILAVSEEEDSRGKRNNNRRKAPRKEAN